MKLSRDSFTHTLPTPGSRKAYRAWGRRSHRIPDAEMPRLFFPTDETIAANAATRDADLAVCVAALQAARSMREYDIAMATFSHRHGYGCQVKWPRKEGIVRSTAYDLCSLADRTRETALRKRIPEVEAMLAAFVVKRGAGGHDPPPA